MKINLLSEIAPLYDVLVFDIWGVIYQGDAPYENVIKQLLLLRSQGKKIIFLSNAPRPSYVSTKRFASWGIEGDNIFFYTSGDLVREQLLNYSDENFKQFDRNIYHLGAEKNEDILASIGCNLVDDISKASFILSSAFLNEEDDLNIFEPVLQAAIARDLPYICANPDTIVLSHQNKKIYCAGYFAQIYEKMGGRVFYYGKPHKTIYQKIQQIYFSDVPLNKVLMIGDTIETDILGAKNFGIDSALVLTGNGNKFCNNLPLLDSMVAKPTWVMQGVGHG
jgi:HAD superfamily hydrolase (TIGR01459 family)